jgi:hypothetical protein
MKFDERNYFCLKVCQTDSDFVGLSRSTRCGCCSYQVSSISVHSYDVLWSLMKEIKNKLKSPLFYFHGNCSKVCRTNSDFFLAYLVPLDMDVTGNITAKNCEVWSEFNIFCTLDTMATAAILNFDNPKSCHTLRWIFLQSFMKFDERNPNYF